MPITDWIRDRSSGPVVSHKPVGTPVDLGPPRPGAGDEPPVGSERPPLGPQTGYSARGQGGFPGLAAGFTVNSAFADTGDIFNPRQPAPLAPSYFAGDEWLPGRLPPSAVAQLQADLVNAGLLDPKLYSRGAWGPESAAAYKQLLEAANASGLSAEVMMERFKSGYEGQAKAKRPPLVVTLSHPDDLRELVNSVSVRTIGRTLSEEEVAPFVSTFQEFQRQYQRQAYQYADPDGTGGEITEPPDFQAYAQRKIREEKPQESAEFAAMGRFNEFMSILSGVGGGALR